MREKIIAFYVILILLFSGMALMQNLDAAILPIGNTLPVTGISTYNATFHGNITNYGDTYTNVYFQYGLTTAYGNVTPTYRYDYNYESTAYQAMPNSTNCNAGHYPLLIDNDWTSPWSAEYIGHGNYIYYNYTRKAGATATYWKISYQVIEMGAVGNESLQIPNAIVAGGTPIRLRLYHLAITDYWDVWNYSSGAYLNIKTKAGVEDTQLDTGMAWAINTTVDIPFSFPSGTWKTGYNTSTSWDYFYGATWQAQNLMVTSPYFLSSISVPLSINEWNGTDPGVYIDLYAVDASHKPTGAPLKTVEINMPSNVYFNPMTGGNRWVCVPFDGYYLSASEYSLVLRLPTGSVGGGWTGVYGYWHAANPRAYSGSTFYSSDSGTSWTFNTLHSLNFKAYGYTEYSDNVLDPDQLYHVRAVFQNSVGTSYGADETFVTEPLIAFFHYSPSEILEHNPVYFAGQSTGAGVSWLWVFGDGSTGAEKNIEHVFASPGSYNVSLTIDDGLINDRYSEVLLVKLNLDNPGGGGSPGGNNTGGEPREGSPVAIDPVVPEPETPLTPDPNEAYPVSEMFADINVPELPVTNSQVTILFIDSGASLGSYNDISLKCDGMFNDPRFNNPYDSYGHGTWVSYVLSWMREYKIPGMKIISYRCFDESGAANVEEFHRALDFAEQIHPDVVSISAGSPDGLASDEFAKHVNHLVEQGIVVVCSAGNDGPEKQTICTPGSADGAIAVGSVDSFNTTDPSDDVVTEWSSRGPVPDSDSVKPDFVAPGESILGPWLGTERVCSGTSMSTPFVSCGIAGMIAGNKGILDIVSTMYFFYGGMKPRIIKECMIESAYQKGDPDSYGYGIPDFSKASSLVFMKALMYLLLPIGIIMGIIFITGSLLHKKYKKVN